MKQFVNVFLPMRAGSERVPQKNTKTFSGISGGLCKIKLEQLLRTNFVNKIFVSTDDYDVVKISKSFNSDKIKIIIRPQNLASSQASTDELIRYVPEIMPDVPILWTHVTSPFIDENIYDQSINMYFKNLGSFDSLMSVTKIQKFIWNKTRPVSYDNNAEKWPRTQTMDPLYEVNGGIFIASKNIYEKCNDRIGNKPFLFETVEEVSFDIDWLSDFKIAEAMFYSLYGSYRNSFKNNQIITENYNKNYILAN